MVGKARGRPRGTPTDAKPSAPGGGTVGGATGENIIGGDVTDISSLPDDNVDLIQNETKYNLDEVANAAELKGAVPDLTGRGTPGGRIMDLAHGSACAMDPERAASPEEHGIGAGSCGNLGVKHGRKGGDIPGAGASRKATKGQEE